MKIKNLILLIIISLITSVFAINHVEAKAYNGYIDWSEEISGVYFTKIRNGEKHSAPAYLIKRSSDNQFVYCLEPGVSIDEGEGYTIVESNQASVLKITNAQWERATLLAYYGYKYGNHTAKKWYAVTQYLIWKTVAPNVDVYFTDGVDGKKITKFTSEINELNNLVNTHLKLPTMANNTYEVGVNQNINLNDNNKVLSNYKIINSKGLKVNISGNTLKVTGVTIGNNVIELQRKDSKYKTPPIIYTHPKLQNVMAVGQFPTINTKLNIKVDGGKLDITKYGENELYINNTYKYENKPLKDVEFELYANEDIYNLSNVLIYSEDEKITEFKTDENGKAIVNNLYLGNYYVIEKATSEDHVLDNEKHEFIISYEENDIATKELILYNHLPKGSFELLKINHKNKALKGAYFEIYNSDNNLVFRGTTNNKGQVIIDKLPLGKYYIKEIKAPNGYKLNKEIIHFEIKKDGEVIKLKFKNDLIVKVPITDKNEIKLLPILTFLFALGGIMVLAYDKKNKRK